MLILHIYCRHILPFLQQLQCNFKGSIAPFSQVSLFLWSVFVSVLHYFIVPCNYGEFG